jgi:hypothetical protein
MRMLATLLLALQVGLPVRSGALPSTTRFGTADQTPIAIAATRNSMLIAWTTGTSIVVTPLEPWLLPDRDAPIHTFTTLPGYVAAGYPQIASDGTEYLLAWAQSHANGISDVYAARFDLGGHLLEGPKIIKDTMRPPLELAWDGNEFALQFVTVLLTFEPHTLTIHEDLAVTPSHVAGCSGDVLLATATTPVSVQLVCPFGCIFPPLPPPQPKIVFSQRWLRTRFTIERQESVLSRGSATTQGSACSASTCVSLFTLPLNPTATNLYATSVACKAAGLNSYQIVATPPLLYTANEPAASVALNGDVGVIAYETIDGGSPAVAFMSFTLVGSGIHSVDREVILARNATRPVVRAAGDGFVVAYEVAGDATTRYIEAVRVGAQPATPRHRGAR